MDQALINLNWSAALLDGLVDGGVRQMVVSPGSRNTPLVLAGSQHPLLALHVQVDERSAAFFALGLACASERPVALVATSGSAVGNWFPAVMEASHSGIPLILLSADRPWELHQCGANQTTDQLKLFGEYCRACFNLPAAEAGEQIQARLRLLGLQAVDKSNLVDPGPVQINVPFREPLVTRESARFNPGEQIGLPSRPRLYAAPEQVIRVREVISGGPGIIVAGNGCGDEQGRRAILELATALAVPVLADPLSGLRWNKSGSSNVIGHYDLFIHSKDFLDLQPAWVLRFGAMPVSRRLQGYLQQHREAQHLVVENRGRWPDPLRLATQVIHGDTALFCEALSGELPAAADHGLLNQFLEQDNGVEEKLQEMHHALPMDGQIIRQLVRSLPEDSLLFSGNSLAVRYLDSYAPKAEKTIRVRGNRGVSGIDGNVSTFMGLMEGSRGNGKAVGIIGDLALFHDMNGLTLAAGRQGVLVVINNGGGGIFHHLPQSRLADFETFWKTPLDLDLRCLADLFKVGFESVSDREGFQEVFSRALGSDGFTIIEVVVDSAGSRQAHEGVLEHMAGS